MTWGGQTNFFGIPIPLAGQKMEASEFSRMLNIIENQLIAGNKGILAGVFAEGVYSSIDLGGGNFSLVLNGSGGNPALSGLVGGGYLETFSTITWTPLVTGNFYYIFVDFTTELFVDPEAFTPTFSLLPPDFTNGDKLYLATVDITGGTPVIDFNPTGKVRISDLTTHLGDFNNPHIVTPAQVGNTTAQWNADKIQGFDIVAPLVGEDTYVVTVDFGNTQFIYTPLPSGDVTGPASAINENIAVYNGTTGKIIKDGLITKAQVQANTLKTTNQTHSGEVDGATALTLNKLAITNKTLVSLDALDHLIIADQSDGDNLKKILASDVLGGGGGGGAEFDWEFDTATADADPTAGKFRMNSGTPASVTEIYVDSLNGSGADMTSILNGYGVGDKIYIEQLDDTTKFIILNITSVLDNTGYFTIGVTVDDSSTIFVSAKDCGFILENVGAIGLTDFDTDLSQIMQFTNGASIGDVDIAVTSDGATVTLSVEKAGGGDIRMLFSTGLFNWDTTPAQTITLTAGSDTSPTKNYIFLPESTKVLTVSTVDFTGPERNRIATVICQSPASVQADGPYSVQAWTDHMYADSGEKCGHLTHINEWIRSKHATYISGVAQTLTITPGAPDNVIFTTASGIVNQLHPHAFPAFMGTPDLYVVNDFTTPYTKVTDLNALLTDSLGNSMSGRRFSLVIWGVVSQETGDAKLYVNLPSGDYGSDSAVIADDSNFANYSIPNEFKGVGFLISELKLRHQTSGGGTWTSVEEVDLRGFFPSLVAGGGVASGTEFTDNSFRVQAVGDNTKEVALDVSAVTTATTRTVSIPDFDVTLGKVLRTVRLSYDAIPTTIASATAVLDGKTGFTGQRVNKSGSIVGIELITKDVRTAGTITARPTIDGVVDATGNVLADATFDEGHRIGFAPGTIPYVAGEVIGGDLVSASWTPAPTDCIVLIDLWEDE